MKIDIAVKDLAAILKKALGVVQTKVTIPVFSYVKFEVSGSVATITASDLGMTIIQQVVIAGSGSGSFLLPAKKTQDFLDNLVGRDTVSIDAEGNTITLKSGKSRTKLATIPVAEFPIPEVKPVTAFSIKLSTLRLLIRKAEIAVPAKEGRYAQPVIQFESNGARLRAVATDGFRIDHYDATYTLPEFKILLVKDVFPLIKELTGEDIDVEFAETETNLFLSTGKEKLLMRKSPAKFPGYEGAISRTTYVTSVAVPVGALKTAFSIARTTAGEGDDAAVYIIVKEGVLSIYSTNAGGEESEDFPDGAVITGDTKNYKIKINPAFVLDFLGQADVAVTFWLADDKSLVKFYPTNETNFLYYTMPMHDAAKTEEKKAA